MFRIIPKGQNPSQRLARDYEKLPQTLAGLHYVMFAMLMLPHLPDVTKCLQTNLENTHDLVL
jgi:hypothetical protein